MNGSYQCGEDRHLQPIWDKLRSHRDLLASPFFPVVFSFTANLVACAPYLLLDTMGPRWPFFHCYKLKPSHSFERDTVVRSLSRICYNHGLFIFPATLLFRGVRSEPGTLEAPSTSQLLRDVIVCLLLFDLLVFFWHWLHHRVPLLYRYLHSLHHQHSSPFALSAQYASGWEIVCLQLLAASIPYLLSCHPLTEMTFFLLNVWLSVEDHCGYDLPWCAHNIVPFGILGGAPFHDLHHQRSRCNYAPYFTYLDKLFGTYKKPSRGQSNDRQAEEQRARERGNDEQVRLRVPHMVKLDTMEQQ
ncbi:cholesterol 25-hydroxylase-like protein [Scyliorhinus canicula]|uniref:cholesterol 25-hydroxylase-like protein n=1 Tax=Scyliorhinus canicula TaxID=7830 RepID=UPI0018F7040B|nr:cholesterol 25-hydroxylase-like protein [Scyliorhinus canicula]